MSITYTYEVISVNETARCMEVVYSSEGRQTMHIGARLPYEGEVLEDIIRMFAPIALWLEAEKVVVPPAVGASGQIVLVPEEPALPQDQPLQSGAQDL